MAGRWYDRQLRAVQLKFLPALEGMQKVFIPIVYLIMENCIKSSLEEGKKT